MTELEWLEVKISEAKAKYYETLEVKYLLEWSHYRDRYDKLDKSLEELGMKLGGALLVMLVLAFAAPFVVGIVSQY